MCNSANFGIDYPMPSLSPSKDDMKYNYNPITNAIDDEDSDNEDLETDTLPYKNNCFYKTKYYIKTFGVTHPRIYALYLLIIQTWPRILVIVDMYTDFVVAYELYNGEQRVWSMLSS
eukprot:235790_1